MTRRRDPRTTAQVLLLVAIAVLVAGALFLASISGNRDLAEQRDDANDRADNAAGVALSLAEQVKSACAAGGATARELGAACGQASSVVATPQAIRGEQGDRGQQGPAGPAGRQGRPGPTGAPGPRGTPGPAGQQGPAGPAGVDGAPGTNGTDGAPGKDGVDGKDGRPGQPPLGWTFTTPRGNTYTCTRVSGFDPDAPRYACTVDQPATVPTVAPGRNER